MSSNNIKDFDAFWAEQKQERIPYKIFGITEYLPPSLPAHIVLEMLRLEKEHGHQELPDEEMFALAISLFGAGKVEEWGQQGLTIDQLADLIEWAFEQYNPGNLMAPKKGPK